MNSKLISENKQNNILLQGLKNLRMSLSSFTMEQFVVTSLEMLMLLERNEYLQNLKENGVRDKGNGSYPRSFKPLSKTLLSSTYLELDTLISSPLL